MPKEKEFSMTADEVIINGGRNQKVIVFIKGFTVSQMIEEMDDELFDEIAKWIGDNWSPEDVFSLEELGKWADKNEYIKQ